MLNESILKCQHCGEESLFVRSGSEGYWQFEACLKCGFARDNEGQAPEDIWQGILDGWHSPNRDALAKELLGESR
jgi:ribosomal protein L37E